jgi:hypothetical protein
MGLGSDHRRITGRFHTPNPLVEADELDDDQAALQASRACGRGRDPHNRSQRVRPDRQPEACIMLTDDQLRTLTDALESALHAVESAARALAEAGPPAEADACFAAQMSRLIATVHEAIVVVRSSQSGQWEATP